MRHDTYPEQAGLAMELLRQLLAECQDRHGDPAPDSVRLRAGRFLGLDGNWTAEGWQHITRLLGEEES